MIVKTEKRTNVTVDIFSKVVWKPWRDKGDLTASRALSIVLRVKLPHSDYLNSRLAGPVFFSMPSRNLFSLRRTVLRQMKTGDVTLRETSTALDCFLLFSIKLCFLCWHFITFWPGTPKSNTWRDLDFVYSITIPSVVQYDEKEHEEWKQNESKLYWAFCN